MSRYDDVFVLCPFFKRRHPNDIVCDGTMEGQEFSVRYSKAEVLDYHAKHLCQKDYKECLLYRMIEEEICNE